MKEFKTLGYDWECGHEDLIIRVLSYADRKRLYIGLYKEENGEWEDFGNLTVNLPHEDVKKNEAFIDHNFFESKLQFIKKYQRGEIFPETAVSGYCTFSKVAFDLDRLEEFDPDGVCAYRELHGEKSSSEDEEEDLDDYTLIKKMHDLTERYLTLDDGLSSAEKAAFRSEKIDEYNEKFMNPSIASMHGYVDEIIKPEATRERVYADILMLADKRSIDVIHKKHGNIPL